MKAPADVRRSIPMNWFRYRRERPEALARIFCLPFAGGTGLTYRPWVSMAPAELEVCPIQPPGRGDRGDEPAFLRMSALVQALADALEPFLDLPYALFGHSMGARVGFELTRALRDRRLREPCHLFVSGSRAPHIAAGRRDLHTLDDAELTDELRRMGGTPDDILDDPVMMRGLLPVVRADFEVLETYEFAGNDQIKCDITAFRGAADPCASREGTEAWAQLTAGRFTMKTLPGDHFFLVPHGRTLLTEASNRLFRAMLPDAAQAPHAGRPSVRP